jgi:hypothetical protein
MRYLHHRGVERGFRIKRYYGIALNRIEADAWFAAHPVALDSNNDVAPYPPSPESDIQI